jgi:drug/metabolite transporter (DMT)-like permease
MENWLYLFFSVFFSAFITVAFKFFSKYTINIFQAILVNYVVCIVTAIIVNKGVAIPGSLAQRPWFYWAVIMGVFFITFFNIMGFAAKNLGVSITTVSNKLSLVIPFILSVYILKATFNTYNVLGCLVAIIAVLLTNYTNNQTAVISKKYRYVLPVVLFFGSGLLDFLIKYNTLPERMNTKEEYLFFITGFASAFILGIMVLIVQLIQGKQRLQYKNIVAGIILGVPNYFSFYFLVKFINCGLMPAATSIPVNNIAVVIGSAIMAYIVVKEKLNIINIIGLICAVAAIILMAQ